MFNTIIRFGLEAFIDLLFAAVLNIKTVTFNNATNIYSSVDAFIWLLLMFSLFWFVAAVPFIVKKDCNEDKVNKSRYSILLKDFKASSSQVWLLNHLFLKKINLCLLENIMFLLRRVFIVFIVLFVNSNGILQISIILVLFLFIMIIKILIKPYKEFTKNVQDIASEATLICMVSIFATFYTSSTMLSSSGSPYILGIVWIILILWIVACHYIWTIIDLIFLIRSKCRLSKVLNKDKMKGKYNFICSVS